MVDPESAPAPPSARPGAVVAVVALGGVLGALARYQIGLWWRTPVGTFPAATLTINLVGCLAIGAFVALVTERAPAHPLIRPFVVSGVLGGFTTFSTYALDIHQLVLHGRVGTATLYLVITAVGSVAAAAVGTTGMRRTLGRTTG